MYSDNNARSYITANVYGHKGATGIVKQRMDSMSEMKDSIKVMADMVKGKIELNPESVRKVASVLTEHSRVLLDYFPDTDESRNNAETEALSVIWTSWDKFEELSNNLKIAVDELQQAADEKIESCTPIFGQVP